MRNAATPWHLVPEITQLSTLTHDWRVVAIEKPDGVDWLGDVIDHVRRYQQLRDEGVIEQRSWRNPDDRLIRLIARISTRHDPKETFRTRRAPPTPGREALVAIGKERYAQ